MSAEAAERLVEAMRSYDSGTLSRYEYEAIRLKCLDQLAGLTPSPVSPTTTKPREAKVEQSFSARVEDRLNGIYDMLVEKNEAYGNSALDPVRIFSSASAEEQILVRIDDKLSRLQRGSEYAGDDTISDLIGYLILLQIARDDRS